MSDKIMAGSNLDDVMVRLVCCCAVLDAIRKSANGDNSALVDAIFGAADLLKSICRDLQADIDGAEDCVEKEATT